MLAYLSDTGLPVIVAGSPVTADPAYDGARRAALIAFVILALVTAIVLARGGRAVIPGIAGAAVGLAVLVLGGLTWGGDPAGVAMLTLQFVMLALATGGVFAAMILGHWYLVTPKLPEAPLVRVSLGLLWVIALQVVLFVVWTGTGAGPGRHGRAVRGAVRAVGAVRLAAPAGRPRVPAGGLVGGAPDGEDTVDGVRDGAPVHQRRDGRRGYDRRGRPVLRRRAPGLNGGHR